MFDKTISGNLSKRRFDELEKRKLGKYVYALRDPRDNKIFYVGQGENDRIFSHFIEAEQYLKDNKAAPSRIIRILDIWKNEEDVDWFIIAHKIEDSADFIESAVIDALSQSQNGVTLNEVAAPKSSLLMQEDIEFLGAVPVDPHRPIERVFIFPIQNALAEGKTPYEATRKAWYVKTENRKLPAYAVGLNKAISIGSFKITAWKDCGEKHEFDGEEDPSLLNKNWNAIISRVKGYWQRGNYLIVKFDGKGKAAIIRGAGLSNQWFNLQF